MTKIKVYECIGGPLCGRDVARTLNMESFSCKDADGETHYYRLIRVVNNENTAAAMYYHYFGTNKQLANKRHPTLLMPADKYKPLKKRR